MSVTASSPDGRLTALVRRRNEVEVRFAPGAYRSYRPEPLSRQLAQLASLTWIRYRRARLATLDDYLGGLVDDGDARPEDREYWDRLAAITVTGTSAHLQVRSRALVSWEVEIADGALDGLSEHEFLAELHSAATTLLADYRARVILLTAEIYDLGLPSRRLAGNGAPGRRP